MVSTAELWSSAWIQSRTFSPGAVELGPDAVDDVGDLAGDELLDVLPGAVVVGAVGDRRPHPEAAHPGPDQQVGAGLGRGVGAARVVRRVLGEPLRVVELRGRRRPRRSRCGGSGRRGAGPPRAACRCRPGWSARTATGRRASCRCATPRRSARPRRGPATRRSTSPASATSPTTSSTRSSGRPASDSRDAAYVILSSTVTRASVLAIRWCTKFEPMKPGAAGHENAIHARDPRAGQRTASRPGSSSQLAVARPLGERAVEDVAEQRARPGHVQLDDAGGADPSDAVVGGGDEPRRLTLRWRRLQASERIAPVVRSASTAASWATCPVNRVTSIGSPRSMSPSRSRKPRRKFCWRWTRSKSPRGRLVALPDVVERGLALQVLVAGAVAPAVEGLRPGEDHRHPVDDLAGLLEPGEVQHHDVVDVGARDVLDRPRQQLRAAVGEGGIDLGGAVARDRDPRVARDRHHLAGAAVRVQVDEHDDVAAERPDRPGLLPHRVLEGAPGLGGVDTHDEEGERLAGRAGRAARAVQVDLEARDLRHLVVQVDHPAAQAERRDEQHREHRQQRLVPAYEPEPPAWRSARSLRLRGRALDVSLHVDPRLTQARPG